MHLRIREDVSVITVFDHENGVVMPAKITWRARDYNIEKVGLHHTYRKGRTLIHVFSCTDGNTFFRLEHDTDNLRWMLMEVTDGEPS